MQNIEQKAKAVELLKQLNIYDGYVKAFEEMARITVFERFIGFWADQYDDVIEKQKAIEEKHGCLVYAITHETVDFGEMYSFLIVPKNNDEFDGLVNSEKNKHVVFAYVWNKTDDELSEFGYVYLRSYGGGLQRIG